MGSSRRSIGQRIMLAAILALILAALVTVRHDTRAATVTVAIQNLAFAPSSVTVTVGTTVTWTNQETAVSKVPHTATSDSGVWNSGLLNPGTSFSFTFTKAGTFTYRCDVHPTMHGTIVVTAPATPTPTATRAPPTAIPTIPPTATTAPTATSAPPTTAPLMPGAPTPTPTIRPTATVKPTATVRATPTATQPGTTPGATVSAASTVIPTETDVPPSSSLAPPTDTDSDDPPPPAVNPFLTVAPVADTATVQFMPQTGHLLQNDFRAFWETHGGAAIFGYPVSEEYREREADGVVRTVQYFERARFEYHDELAGTPYAVELGALARALTMRRLNEQPFQPIPTSSGPDRVWFDGTGHSLSGAFKQYWDGNGGIAIFGLPISEPFMEKGADDGATYLVQYFERARFELHTASAGTTVVLGRLGIQYAQWYGMLPST